MSVDEKAIDEARRVREAYVSVFLEAYEDAGIRGLCREGRLEAAVDAVRNIDLEALSCAHRPAEDELVTGEGASPESSLGTS